MMIVKLGAFWDIISRIFVSIRIVLSIKTKISFMIQRKILIVSQANSTKEKPHLQNS